MTRRSIEDIKARADEFADAFENYEPEPGDQDAPLPPTMAVKLAAWRRDAAERELAEAVRAARGASALMARDRRSHRHQRRSCPSTLRRLSITKAPPTLDLSELRRNASSRDSNLVGQSWKVLAIPLAVLQ